MRSKVLLVLLLAFILVSSKTHLKKNIQKHSKQGGWGQASATGNNYGNGTWDQTGGSTWDNHDNGTWDQTGGSTWDNNNNGSWDQTGGSTWDNNDNGSWDQTGGSTWDNNNNGTWGGQEEFDASNQAQVEHFEEAADNEYVEHIGNLDEFERTYNAYNIQSTCFDHLQREELELFLFQGYVRYLYDLYWDLQYQKWWAEYQAQWENYYSDYYYYETQYYEEAAETGSNDTIYDDAYYQEHYGNGSTFDNSYLHEYVEEDFIPSEDTIGEIDSDFEDISHAGDEGYDGQLFELVKLRNKLRSKNTSTQEYEEAVNFFKLGYMTGFIDAFTDYAPEARDFIHLSFYDQSLFGAYLGQLSRYLENYGCTGEQIRVYYSL